ncbi:hypothetical protein [Leptospira levettii]|uniref:hypothetical protein n=1 Tax=Leptospira levettii TaxID=2023178 RepID=UPI000C29FF3D|nr:hypothetical protein [Leptospira levettii]PJZ89549.1 hypothetical protein CH368_06215 [Leptospira levettii]
MFEKVIEGIRKNFSENGNLPVRKSENGNQPNLPELATEITGLLDSGDVSPDVDSVRVWSQSKGLNEESANTFAETVINAYFDDEEEGEDMADQDDLDQDDLDNEDPDLENEEGEPGEEEEEDDEALVKSGLEYLHSLSTGLIELKKSIGVIAEAQMKILDKQNEDKEEILALKSELGKLAGQPAVRRNPVQEDPGLNIRKGVIGGMSFKDQKDLILKGVKIGSLSLNDISVFESTGVLTKEAEAYITQEVKK